MKDQDIREVLLKNLNKKYSKSSNTLIVEELGLCQGSSIVDLAVINGKIHGYEIKSARDNLNRLPLQIDFYNKNLDTVTIVASENHIDAISKMVPNWWGVSRAKYTRDKLKISKLNLAKQNPNVDCKAIIQLLWKEEALDILNELGLKKGFTNKPKEAIWSKIVSNLNTNEVKKIVRQKLKARQHWKSALPQK